MIKNMNSKMTTNSQLSTTKNKEKTKTNKYNRKRITQMEITWRVISRERERGKWAKRYKE